MEHEEKLLPIHLNLRYTNERIQHPFAEFIQLNERIPLSLNLNHSAHQHLKPNAIQTESYGIAFGCLLLSESVANQYVAVFFRSMLAEEAEGSLAPDCAWKQVRGTQ